MVTLARVRACVALCRPSLFKAVLKVMGWRVYVMVGLEATFRGMWILRYESPL